VAQKTKKRSFPLLMEIFGKLRYFTLIIAVILVSSLTYYWIKTGDPVEGFNRLLKAFTDFFNNIHCDGK